MKIRRGIFLLVFASSVSVFAQTTDDAFERGNEAYRAGRFEEAVREYSGIVGQGYVSAGLFFNLGNAYYRSGGIARAILSYERAAKLDPGDPDIEFNLRLANLRIIDRIDPIPELFLLSWLRSLTTLAPMSTMVVLLMAAWLALFGQLAGVNLVGNPFWNAMFRWGIVAAVLLVIVFGLVLGLQIQRASDRSDAIVMSQSITAKNSPDTQSLDAFVIHEGLKVRVSDIVGEWAKITLADGKVGWIRTGDFEYI